MQIQSTMNTILAEEYYSSPDSGLVGYWRLDEGTGQTAEDLSYYGNDATLGISVNPDASDPTWVQANILILNVEDEINYNPVPTRFSLSQNYPNPFNPVTTIKFTIPSSPLNPSPLPDRQAGYQGEGKRERLIILKVYDVLGNEIATLVNEEKPAGTYEINWYANNSASGIYFYQIRAGDFIKTKKMLLIK